MWLRVKTPVGLLVDDLGIYTLSSNRCRLEVWQKGLSQLARYRTFGTWAIINGLRLRGRYGDAALDRQVRLVCLIDPSHPMRGWLSWRELAGAAW